MGGGKKESVSVHLQLLERNGRWGPRPTRRAPVKRYGHSAGSQRRFRYWHLFRSSEPFKGGEARDQRLQLDGSDVVRAAFYNSPTAIDEGFADLNVVGCDRDVAKAAEQAQADGNVRLGVHPYLFECGIQEVFEVNPVDTDARNSMEVVKARFGQIS
jgi:hypothetical protein